MKKKLMTLVLCGAIAVGATGCGESWERMEKDLESEYGGGLTRQITVRDVNGNITEQYTGKFDVTYDGDRLKFIDDDNKVHLIYPGVYNITINEI